MASAQLCPYCAGPVSANTAIVECPRCQVLYHAECWEANDGCATFGCSASPADRGGQHAPAPLRLSEPMLAAQVKAQDYSLWAPNLDRGADIQGVPAATPAAAQTRTPVLVATILVALILLSGLLVSLRLDARYETPMARESQSTLNSE